MRLMAPLFKSAATDDRFLMFAFTDERTSNSVRPPGRSAIFAFTGGCTGLLQTAAHERA
jgi:hypothetical protein